MRWLTLLAAFAIAAPLPAQETAEEPAPAYEGALIKRWSPVVSDLDRAILLYRDILGFELARVYEDRPESYVYTIFNVPEGVTTRHAVFNAGAEQRVLSVVEVPGMISARLTEAPRQSALLVNANGRFDEIVALLDKHGFERLPMHALGATGIEMGFLDQDGHLYSLYEIPYNGGYGVGN